MNVQSRADGGSDDPSRTRIVGLGGSGGGREALEQVFANSRPDSGLAYVVLQHHDPTHKAMLVELLQRATTLPVREVADSMRVEPSTVYVIPPNNDLSVLRGLLGMVLSGMGSDGTVGLQAIKIQGGLTLAQQPESALGLFTGTT